MAESSSSVQKLPLPAFLKVLTSNNVPVKTAMAVAGKIYKTHNTPAALGQLTDLQLKQAGVNEKEDRKVVLTAVRKAGFKSSPSKREIADPIASSSKPASQARATTKSSPKKRKRDDELNEFLSSKPLDEGATYGSLEFNEVLDEKTLITKSSVVNRAPIMMAWATVVAERLGFKREEALSIASVYTEMNAITKGVSLGIYKDDKKKEMPEASKDGMQPYVDLMGRRIPLYQTSSELWLALSSSSPVAPGAAYSYIARSFRQTTSYVLGALRLLAETYEPADLNKRAFGLYCEFRPQVGGWGEKGTVKCETILQLRKQPKRDGSEAIAAEDEKKTYQDQSAKGDVRNLPAVQYASQTSKEGSVVTPAKKARTSSSDEFDEEGLDDIDWGQVDLP